MYNIIAILKMKTSYYIFLIIVLLIVLGVSIPSGVMIRPYHESNIYRPETRFEGMTGRNHALEYSTASDNKTEDSYQSYMINKSGMECKKVFGFDGLFCKPYVADSTNDVFSKATGSLTCNNQSSGLTNSKGSLCLDEKMKKLLSTRGGNASGGESQIGK